MGILRNDSSETRLWVPQQTMPELWEDVAASDASPQTLCSIEHHQQPTHTPAPFEMLPIDIFYETLQWLEPLDLLHCARISKRYRAVTLSPAAKPYWAAALRNIPGLPERPMHISAPRYAFLVFERFCEVCGAAGGLMEVSYVYGCRMCGPCWEVRYPHGFQLMVGDFQHVDPLVFPLLPMCGAVSEAHADFAGARSAIARMTKFGLGQQGRYERAEFGAVAKEYGRLGGDEGARAGFVAECRARVMERYEWEFDVLKWKQACSRGSGS